MQLSVIICTHNPRREYLNRTLNALRAQTSIQGPWELLLVDNASNEPLEKSLDLSWHPHGRHVREEALGVTPARLRGMTESKGEVLVFVDDDNVLNPQYISSAVNILNAMPWLGAIGGQILPEYEIPPPHWLPTYERLLAIRRANQPRWSNAVDDWQSQPWGAGMVVRKSVCDRYRLNLENSPVRRDLDRKGTSLVSGGDTDLILTSLDLGLGFGVFPEMVVTHLIPKQRMTEEYICRLTQGLVTSNLWLAQLRGDPIQLPPKQTLYTQTRALYHFLKRSSLSRQIDAATQAGVADYLERVKK